MEEDGSTFIGEITRARGEICVVESEGERKMGRRGEDRWCVIGGGDVCERRERETDGRFP